MVRCRAATAEQCVVVVNKLLTKSPKFHFLSPCKSGYLCFLRVFAIQPIDDLVQVVQP